MGSTETTLVFSVNGRIERIENPDPTMLLIDYLRGPNAGLTGTKLGCGEGGCGACTVTLSTWNEATDLLSHRPVNACLRALCSLDGQSVTTTEGIGNLRDGLHPVQYEIAACNGSQCGFCTPGFVMNMFAGIAEGQPLDSRQIEDRFDGHICRCTGFRPILQAMRTFASDADAHRDFLANHPCRPAPGEGAKVAHPPAGVVFPDALKARVRERPVLAFAGRGYQWHRPRDLGDVQAILAEHDGDRSLVKLVGGNTDIGIYKVAVSDPKILVDVAQIPALQGIETDSRGIRFGATTTLEELLRHIDANSTPDPAWQGLQDLRRHMDIVANLQVRGVGTIAGNVMLAWRYAGTQMPFPSDLLLTFIGLGGGCTIASSGFDGGGHRFDIADVPPFSALPADAVVTGFDLPWAEPARVIRSYKVRMRAEDSHPIVNAACSVAIDKTLRATGARLIFGGLRGLPIRAARAEAALEGQLWDNATLAAALAALQQDVAENIAEFDGTMFYPPDYRASLCRTLFYKFFVHAAETRSIPVSAAAVDAGKLEFRPLSRGTETTDVYPAEAPVGMPFLKEDVFLQPTGEAIFTEDMPLPRKGLYAAYVLSTIASGGFAWRGGSPAAALVAIQLLVPGVADLVTVEDVPILATGTDPASRPNNNIGLSNADPVFAQNGTIISWGQPIALVLARDNWSAQTASRLLGADFIVYDPKQPVLNIEAALALPDGKGVFQDDPANGNTHIPAITRKGSDERWLDAPDAPLPNGKLLTGVQRTEAQAQFYMETQNCLVVPGERDSFKIYSATQQPAAAQWTASSVLGIPAANIQVYVRRLGGGFGGKQFRPYMLSSACAVAAWKTRMPVKLVLTRNQDMQTIGKRHPYRNSFAVSYLPDGKLQAMRLDMVSNGGCSYDASFPVMDLSQQCGDGAYYVPTFRTTGTVAKTNMASNTAMRSFGIVQATLGLEEAIERVAHATGRLPEDVRRLNMYETATKTHWQQTHFGQDLDHCNIAPLYDNLREHCQFDKRHAGIRAFNAASRWRKRGISLIPLKYGVGYQPRSMEQGSAYVSIYQSDGSVLVQTGGIEMGQGLNTKMQQIAAQELGIPMKLIRIGETWTGTAPNSEPTAASSGSDLFGSALKMACAKLRQRLIDYCAYSGTEPWFRNPERWPLVVAAAFNERIDLQAEATYRVPWIDSVGGDKPYGRAFLYFTYSAACSEVEIDVLTGETTILRTDILFDNGKSLNPCLDTGQLEGGYVQGTGLMLSEQMMYTPDGALYSDGTWDYKPPGSKSIPIEFNVRLHEMQRHHAVTGLPLDDASVNGSRGIGEPPLVLATTVFFAVKHAVQAARRDRGDESWPEFEAPATVGRIQQAIGVPDAALRI